MEPVRSQNEPPQERQRNFRKRRPSLAGWVPLETMLPAPVLPNNAHCALGQASALKSYLGLRPRFAILVPPWEEDSRKRIFINHYRVTTHYSKKEKSQTFLTSYYGGLNCHIFSILDKVFLYEATSGSLFSLNPSIYATARALMWRSAEGSAVDMLLPEDIRWCMERSKDHEPYTPVVKYDIRSMTLHLCHTCNLMCRYCYGKAGAYNGEGEMTETVACKAVDFLLQSTSNRSLRLSFFGGEPLLNFKVLRKTVLYAIARRLPALQWRFHVTTNGTIMSPEIASFLER